MSGSIYASQQPAFRGGGGALVPVNTVLPVASGALTVGATLSTTDGSWANSPLSFAYQWVDSLTGNVPGATSNTLVTTAANLGHLLSCAVTAINGAGSGAAQSNQLGPITAGANGVVEANGFVWESPTTPPTYAPDTAPEFQTWSTEGFTAAGGVTAYARNLVKTQRIRQPFPNQASLTPFNVSLSDYVYATCVSAGITNASAMVSPKPVANWIMPHRLLVDTQIVLEVTAHHRDAQNNKQVACVVFTATDGVLTVTQTVASTVLSPQPGDVIPTQVYRAVMDVSTLGQGLVTVNAKVYPWYGVTASINDTTLNGTSDRQFSPRYFLRNTARFAARPLAYVNTAGNDATGVWSANPVTAAATPYLTIGGALIGGTVGGNSAVTGNIFDGCEIRIGAGIASATTNLPATARAINVAALIITRDPAVPKANAVFAWSGLFRTRIGQSGLTAPITTGAQIFSDISILRNAAGTMDGVTNNMDVYWQNVNFDNNNVASSWLTSTCTDSIYGMVVSNMAVTPFPLASTAPGSHDCLRAVTITGFPTAGMEGFLLVGCVVTNSGSLSTAPALPTNGSIRFNNRFINNYFSNGAAFAYGFSQATTGAVFSQNVMECLDATGNSPGIGISHDGATASTNHIILHNNTGTGFDTFSRSNLFYDDGGTARTNVLQSVKGNIFVSINTKSDVYESDGTRVGNWGFLYGVGCQGNFTQYVSANGVGFGGSFSQAYPGLGCNYGTSSTVRNDPLFVNYQGTTGPPATAGAGGGNYNVTSASPAKGMVSSALFAFDILGVARLTTGDTAGAYKAP